MANNNNQGKNGENRTEEQIKSTAARGNTLKGTRRTQVMMNSMYTIKRLA
ncbi:hypothetical protein [Pontibacillus salipaludis]